ncbi:MAG: type IV secretory system conjugative DNA transfer family protein [Lachnospiraceae bacterium]|nr:type IV secretory system conjugative DNA transfer family protein [Lachnospiraceae bacterium]
MANNKTVYQTSRILAKNVTMSNDTWATGLNNNDLIIGPSGAGKTRGYVKPNILQANGSMVIADTKGNLYEELSPFLEKKGYRTLLIDFKEMKSTCGYNPMDYLPYDRNRKCYSEEGIRRLCTVLAPSSPADKDPFWNNASRQYLECLMAYVMECLPPRERSLEYVIRLFGEMQTKVFDNLMKELMSIDPECYASKIYRGIMGNMEAEKMHASILGILSEHLNGLNTQAVLELYNHPNKLAFETLGQEKTALFLSISDTDRSSDKLVSLFYTQALQALCSYADQKCEDNRLPMPVRFILDDFATNCVIESFDNIISVIRSREIYVSIIIQSISQLNGVYGPEKAKTIINNCDNCLYLGGLDVGTADYFSIKTNMNMHAILNMPLDNVLLFTRGRDFRQVEKYDLCSHPDYEEMQRLQKAARSRKILEAVEKTDTESVPDLRQRA